MFDAKALLEQLAGNAAPQGRAPSQQGGGLSDLLGQLTSAVQGGGSPTSGGAAGGATGGGLGDLLRNVTGGGGAPGAGGGGLDQILGQLKDQAGKLGIDPNTDILSTLGSILGQATEGVKEGATRVGDATGARDALNKATGGRSPDELMAQVKDLIAKNQLGAGAVLGGLGAVLLGTRTGRSLTGSAVKLGALTLIGGLAYKAYQNHQTGKPLLTGGGNVATAAPAGSGFEADAMSNEAAALMIRAMIAAAAADGRIDDNERSRILSTLGDAAGNPEARAFLEQELRAPASVATLAAAVSSEKEGLEVYTAARIAIDADTPAEQQFLQNLARAIGIDPDLAAHIDATARSASA